MGYQNCHSHITLILYATKEHKCTVYIMLVKFCINIFTVILVFVLIPCIIEYVENDQQNALNYIPLFISCDGSYMFRQ
jgi:hypothetical protein